MNRVLVAGVGNIFFGDDGFGVEVARRLLAEPVPAGVQIEDFGIRGVHLAYQLLDGYDTLILIDALPRKEQPGTIYVIEPELDDAADDSLADAHSMNPLAVLAMLKTLGGQVGRVLLVGCEPAELVERIGLSATVLGAIDQAAAVVSNLIQEAILNRTETATEA